MVKRITVLSVLCLLAIWGGLHLLTQSMTSAPATGRTVLSVYTTGQATTPQMPLWKALAEGDLDFTADIHYWKDLNDLRGLLLSGKGDIWVGHIDGFAQAALRGAPIRLVSVTGWKKFYILSSRGDVISFDQLMTLAPGTEIAVTPPQSPGVAVLRAMEPHGLPAFTYAPFESKQLALKTVQGTVGLLVAPEPLVTVLLQKNPKLHIIACVEEQYGRMTGKPAMLPMAGIAVNTRTLERYPELADQLEAAMAKQETSLLHNPEAGLETLPKAFETFIPRDTVRASLARDIIRVRSAQEARDMIQDYLAMVFPDGGSNGRALPDSFFGAPR
ncbi:MULTISPECIES: hypothetical protein [unclassified Pseudodesulfovibrio]|uniref:hypothetical protein n=1 Tax=unclassified Pseudodesulfovibrio TaxID=2661612 RepID=UPI000FEBE41B|nr:MULTISPECIES: hypothetical protein [unclassified Pseudodesulfovibrio]MCJ2163403.1 hypothetical protein [Pseudodesulfovibrio sp. S3-i]RWU06639.1 hypothetical protein DWB63_02435 [Pseudodesulfovibrio sp. S3]